MPGCREYRVSIKFNILPYILFGQAALVFGYADVRFTGLSAEFR